MVARYSVDASDGLIPECFKATDIAAFGREADAVTYCITSYARELDISCDVQYFYRVRCVEVDTRNDELEQFLSM